MKRQYLILLMLIFILGMATTLVLAQDDEGNPNDPATNDRANACYEDGSMAGKCDTQWEWECGWYLIRFEDSLISREIMPVFCESLLPAVIQDAPPVVIDPPVPPVPEVCYNHQVDPRSVKMIGSANTIGNSVYYDALDCNPPVVVTTSMIVTSPDSLSALLYCISINPAFNISLNITLLFPGFPPDHWLCYVI